MIKNKSKKEDLCEEGNPNRPKTKKITKKPWRIQFLVELLFKMFSPSD